MQTSALIPYVTVGLFGLAFGSFLNVCIFRLPHHESVIAPRSYCPRCRKPIRWYDNIPVVSYLLLAGQCRDCGGRISPLYPLVEILTAGFLVVAFGQHGLSASFVQSAIFGMLLLILVFTDLRTRQIPHVVTLFGIGTGLLLSLVVPVDSRPAEWLLRRLGFFLAPPFSSLLGAVSGALVGGGLFYAVGETFFHLGGRKREFLGFGDVMLMLMVGTFLGVPLTLLTILLGSLVGTLIALPLEIFTSRFHHYQWPYGTFLGAGALYASLGGKELLDSYLRWAGLA